MRPLGRRTGRANATWTLNQLVSEADVSGSPKVICAVGGRMGHHGLWLLTLVLNPSRSCSTPCCPAQPAASPRGVSGPSVGGGNLFPINEHAFAVFWIHPNRKSLRGERRALAFIDPQGHLDQIGFLARQGHPQSGRANHVGGISICRRPRHCASGPSETCAFEVPVPGSRRAKCAVLQRSRR